MGKRWNNPNYLLALAETEGVPEIIAFWRRPVLQIKLERFPVFLLPCRAGIAAEVSEISVGKRIYYEMVRCPLALASATRESDPAALVLSEPLADAESRLGAILG